MRPPRALLSRLLAGALVAPLAVVLGLQSPAAATGGSVVDAFDRPDASTLGSTSGGIAWQAHAGAFSVAAQTAAAGSGYGLASLDTSLQGATVSVTVAQPGQEMWLVLRLTDGANYWRFGRSSSGSYQLQHVLNNNLASPALTTLATVNAAAGDRLSCATSAGITCSVNGQDVIRTADGANASSTRYGIATWQSNGVRFDDFRADPAPVEADLVTTVAAPASVIAGQSLQATATVSNTGSSAATGASLTWTVPADLGAVSGTGPGGPCAVAATTVECGLGSLAAGAAATVTLSATAPTRTGSVDLALVATHAVDEATPANNSAGVSVALRPALSADTVVADAFERADTTSGGGTTDTGHTWTTHAGTPHIASLALSPGGGYGLTTVDSGQANAVVSTTVAATGTEHWLVLRLATPADYWRFGRSNGGTYQLQQVKANGLGSPAVDVLSAPAAAAGDRLTCRLTSTTIACDANGVAVARSDDAFNRGATRHGFAAWQSPQTRFDDFLVSTVTPRRDLRVVVGAPSSVEAGAPFTAQVTVSNAGQAAATNAAVAVTLPSGVSVATGSSAGCVAGSGSVTCSLGDLAAGQSASATVNLTAPAATGTITTTATATAAGQDDNPADDTGSATTLVHQAGATPPLVSDSFNRPDSASPGTADSGQPWTVRSGSLGVASGKAAIGGGYTLATVDAGASDGITSLTVAQPDTEFWMVVRLADNANYWRFGRSGNGPYVLQQVKANGLGSPALTQLATVQPAAGDRLECRAGAGLTCSVNGTGVVMTNDTFNATATHVGLSSWNSPATRLDDLRFEVPAPQRDLRVVVGAPSSVEAGAPFTAQVTVSNAGQAAATNAAVAVTLPSGVSVATGSSAGCVAGSGSVTCSLGDLAAGQSASATVNLTAPAATGTITTTATATAAGQDDNPADDTGSATTLVHQAGATPPLVSDSFNRPDSASPGTADSGQPWTVRSGSLGVASGKAAIGGGYTLATVDAGASDGITSLTVAQPDTEFWMVVRLADNANYWRFGRSGNGPYVLQQVKANGLGSPALTQLATVQPAAGDRLECRAGAGLTCSVNGTGVVMTNDTFNATATHVGLSSWNSPATRLDDLHVVELPREADLSVVLSGNRSATTSASFQVTATVVNQGTAAAPGSQLQAVLPSGAAITSVNSTSGSCSAPALTVTCQWASLAPGATATVTIAATAPATAGPVATTATVSTSAADAQASNDSASLTTTVRTPAPPGAMVRDDFERPTGAGLGSTTTGEQWTTHLGAFGIASGQAAASTSAMSLASVDAGFSAGTYEVSVPAGASQSFWLALRVVDGNNYYRFGPDPWSGNYRLAKIVGGVEQQMYANWTRAAVQAQDGDVIRIVVRPDDGIYAWVNGKHVTDAGDTQFMDSTGFGIATASSATRFDDLHISAALEAYPVADTFTRPDTSSGLGTPEVGTRYPWRTWVGQPWAVAQNQAAPRDADYSLVAIDSSSEAAGVAATVTALGGEQWLVLRYAEDGSYYRFGAHSGGQYQVEFVRDGVVVPSPVTVDTVSSVALAAGDRLSVVQHLDGRVEASVNGALTHRFTDATTNVRATIYGMAATGTTARFDDFGITLAPRP